MLVIKQQYVQALLLFQINILGRCFSVDFLGLFDFMNFRFFTMGEKLASQPPLRMAAKLYKAEIFGTHSSESTAQNGY